MYGGGRGVKRSNNGKLWQDGIKSVIMHQRQRTRRKESEKSRYGNNLERKLDKRD